jgi:branched-chain amino acid transport system substrate-binding protein
MRLAASLTFASVTLIAASAQAQTTNVKIGVLTDMSSLYADDNGAGSVTAVKMAVQDFNPAAHGMAVEVINADHQNKPDIGANIARQWYDVDHVDMIVDVPNSGVALAVNEVAREKNKVFLVSGAAISDLTGPKCSPNTVHWTYDTWMLAHSTAGALAKSGGDSWFFLTADYAFGHALERDTATVVTANGGKVLGEAAAPLNTADFSSFLLQAQASKAKVIGLANAGGDTINSIKQASEFGITKGGQQLAGLLVFVTDIHGVGLKTAQGMYLTEAFYWDANDQTRAFSKRFMAKVGHEPAMTQAGDYSATLHYLKAVKAAGSTDPDKVMAKMREMPVNDMATHNGRLRIDGRLVRDMYLYQVKTPAESKGPWDYYKLIRTIPGDEVTRPLNQGDCPLVKG